MTAPASRRRPLAVVREWPLVLTLLVAGAGLAWVAADHFRRGTVLFSVAVCLAATLRAVLPNESVGLLRVRSRGIDVLTLGTLGVVTLVAALIVPPPS